MSGDCEDIQPCLEEKAEEIVSRITASRETPGPKVGSGAVTGTVAGFGTTLLAFLTPVALAEPTPLGEMLILLGIQTLGWGGAGLAADNWTEESKQNYIARGDLNSSDTFKTLENELPWGEMGNHVLIPANLFRELSRTDWSKISAEEQSKLFERINLYYDNANRPITYPFDPEAQAVAGKVPSMLLVDMFSDYHPDLEAKLRKTLDRLEGEEEFDTLLTLVSLSNEVTVITPLLKKLDAKNFTDLAKNGNLINLLANSKHELDEELENVNNELDKAEWLYQFNAYGNTVGSDEAKWRSEIATEIIELENQKQRLEDEIAGRTAPTENFYTIVAQNPALLSELANSDVLASFVSEILSADAAQAVIAEQLFTIKNEDNQILFDEAVQAAINRALGIETESEDPTQPKNLNRSTWKMELADIEEANPILELQNEVLALREELARAKDDVVKADAKAQAAIEATNRIISEAVTQAVTAAKSIVASVQCNCKSDPTDRPADYNINARPGRAF